MDYIITDINIKMPCWPGGFVLRAVAQRRPVWRARRGRGDPACRLAAASIAEGIGERNGLPV